MIKKILLGMTLLMSMVSCTEDYTDWATVALLQKVSSTWQMLQEIR